MKALSKIALLGASLALAVSANAAIGYGMNTGEMYVGVKAGQVHTEKNQLVNISKKPISYGVYGGYNFDQNFGAEVDFQRAEIKNVSVGNLSASYDAKSYGGYGTYRYHLGDLPFYAKGKLGVAKTDADVKVSNGTTTASSQVSSTTGLAGGAGLGFKQGNFGVEAMYNYLNKDSAVISVGAQLAF